MNCITGENSLIKVDLTFASRFPQRTKNKKTPCECRREKLIRFICILLGFGCGWLGFVLCCIYLYCAVACVVIPVHKARASRLYCIAKNDGKRTCEYDCIKCNQTATTKQCAVVLNQRIERDTSHNNVTFHVYMDIFFSNMSTNTDGNIRFSMEMYDLCTEGERIVGTLGTIVVRIGKRLNTLYENPPFENTKRICL